MGNTILIVDDHYIITEGIKNMIERMAFRNCSIYTAETGEKAKAVAYEVKPDILITDIRLPDISGIDLISIMKNIMPSVRIIAISAYDKFEYAQKAIREGVADYLVKPINRDELFHIMEKLVDGTKDEETSHGPKSTDCTGKGSTLDEVQNCSMIVTQALDYVDANYHQNDLSLSYVSNLVSKSYNYFSAIFKKETAYNFTDYLTLVRVKKSKNLLMDFDKSIKDVAFEVGFNDSIYYCKMFKKITGITPTQFRQSHICPL